jgi:hypothetical protein
MKHSTYYITPAGNIVKREQLTMFAKFVLFIFGIIWLIPVFFAVLIIGGYMAVKNIYH